MRILLISLGIIAILASCKTSSDNMTPSGFAYTVINEGSGEVGNTDDYVFFTAKIFDDQEELLEELTEGDEMPVLQIPESLESIGQPDPFGEMFKMVGAKVGGVYRLVMPIDSLPNINPDIAHNKFLTYELGVTKILDQEGYQNHMTERMERMNAAAEEYKQKLPAVQELVGTTVSDFNAGKLPIESTESGLKYYIVKGGEGENAKIGDNVKVSYYGVLSDGERFDDSFSRGPGFNFQLGMGQVIPGWDEGIRLFNKGTKAFLFIPSGLAYGEAGSPPVIQPNSDLVFYVELEDIN